MTDWKRVQHALADKGFDPGPIDGLRGRLTNAAIIAFKRSVGLKATSYFGPLTEAKLFGEAVANQRDGDAPDAPWMDIALEKKGMHEKRDYTALSTFLKAFGGYLGDPRQLPWCGDFVESCIAYALPNEALPSNPYLARNWLKFGKPCDPQHGAVMVFWRGSKSGISGHVAFYVGEDASTYHVLGGNQSNAVTITRISKDRFLGARWPISHKAGDGKRRVREAVGLISTNEA